MSTIPDTGRWTRTRHHAGRVWTLDRGLWTAGPDGVFVVHIRPDAVEDVRMWSPGRAPMELYPSLADACKREVELYEASRLRAIVALDAARLDAARAREAAKAAEAARQRAVDAALAEQARGRRYAAGAAFVALLVLACAGVWGMS